MVNTQSGKWADAVAEVAKRRRLFAKHYFSDPICIQDLAVRIGLSNTTTSTLVNRYRKNGGDVHRIEGAAFVSEAAFLEKMQGAIEVSKRHSAMYGPNAAARAGRAENASGAGVAEDRARGIAFLQRLEGRMDQIVESQSRMADVVGNVFRILQVTDRTVRDVMAQCGQNHLSLNALADAMEAMQRDIGGMLDLLAECAGTARTAAGRPDSDAEKATAGGRDKEG